MKLFKSNAYKKLPKSLLHGIVSSAKLHYDLPSHHPSVFCDEHINFMLFAFYGVSWKTAVK
jgi:hypothetical protein